jgi:hypothetical protein
MIICDDLHLIRQTLSDQIESDDRFTLVVSTGRCNT